ncbi:MAG: hypothetical protein H8E60_05605 [Candidatus Marinimicrobia bacterium]|nr:hypothetical protein [Candidatus Neomarinimicrobiota bacterium]
MNKFRQLYHCLILSIFIFIGCEQKPLILDLGEDGLILDVITLSQFSTQTEQPDTLVIGESFKLYVGTIDSTRSSQILININPIALQNSSTCNDSTQAISSYIELRSTSEIYHIVGDENENPVIDLNKQFGIDSTQYNACFIPNLDSIYNWDNNSINISNDFNPNLGNDIIPLEISISQFGLKIYLDSILSTTSICDFNEPIHILLHDGQVGRLTEFFSTEFYGTTLGPRVNTDIEVILTEEIQLDRFSINTVNPSFLNENDYEIEQDIDGNVTGIFKSKIPDIIIDSLNVVAWSDTAKEIELFKIDLELENILLDSLGIVNLFFHSLNFSNSSLTWADDLDDPASDNWNIIDSTGTENNEIWDFGEYFEDCGNDGVCDIDELGYNPVGTENNEVYDYGEYFDDFGTDGLPDSLEENYHVLDNPDPSNDNYLIDPNNDNWGNTLLYDSSIIISQEIDSVDCYLEYFGTEYHTWLTSSNANLDLLNSWCGDLPNNNCSSCDTLYKVIEFFNSGTEGNGIWDLGEDFLDLGFDNYPENIENNDDQEGNGIWDFDDLNDNGIWDYGEPHESWADCGIDNLCDLDEAGYNPNGSENNLFYDLGELFLDCGIDGVCEESPDIFDDYNIDPNGDNWSYEDSTGTELNSLLDEGEFWRDWGVDQLPDSLENSIISNGGSLNISTGTNNWEFEKYEIIDTIFARPELTSNDDIVIWVSSIVGSQNNYHIGISIYSLKNITQFEIGVNHIPFFDYEENIVQETKINTNYTLDPIDEINFINDISAYPKVIINENDSNNFHINYSDNFISKIEIPNLDSLILSNQNMSVSQAILHLTIDTTNINYHINENGIKILFSKFNNLTSDVFSNEKTLLYSKVVKHETKLDIDFTTEMQRLLTDESNNYGFILEASGESNNFSQLTFYNESDSLFKPTLEIMLIK